MKVVISQPMLFPWVGMLEQIMLADVFVHYADVQFSKGSFTNRVQIKDSTGPGGRGIGLALVQQTATRLGGGVDVTAGPGAVFTVRIPVPGPASEQAEHVPEAESDTLSTPVPGGPS